MPGEYIQISPDFLINYPEIEKRFGPPGQVFVHEFAKFRYGVFENFGFPGDAQYPMFYFKTEWTPQGQVNKITPNFGVKLSNYTMVDAVTGGNCSLAPGSNLQPDAKCIPIVGTNNNITSSIMSIPFLPGNDQFSDRSNHQSDTPTKHNVMCNGRSAFEVIKQHTDFCGFKTNNNDGRRRGRTYNFQFQRSTTTAEFVMVLDVSGSMGGERIKRMKNSAMRFVQLDIPENFKLGLVTFNDKSKTIKGLTKVQNQVVRTQFSDELCQLSAGGGTCLAEGLKEGLKTLSAGGVPQGGIMIFMTDGADGCSSKMENAIQLINAQGVRVITVAFSKYADPNLSKLARETNGMSLFIPDNTGPDAINSVLQEALAFQPSVPSSRKNYTVRSSTLKSFSTAKTKFTIDPWTSTDVMVQVDVMGDPGSDVTVNNDPATLAVFTSQNCMSGVYVKEYASLSPGDYEVTIATRNGAKIDFASVKVTARATSNTAMPITVDCWAKFVSTNHAGMSNIDSNALYAHVKQGSNPVINAKVVAHLLEDGNPQPLTYYLVDSGAHPDLTANDGLYTGHFITSGINTAGHTRYSLKCHVEGTSNTRVIDGIIGVSRNSRSLPNRPSPAYPLCCGSNALQNDSVGKLTGSFQRFASGGSIEVKNGNLVKYGPSQITNFRGQSDVRQNYFTLYFTSTGNTLDAGTVSSFTIYYTDRLEQVQDVTAIRGTLSSLTADYVSNPDSLQPKEAGTPVAVKVLKTKIRPGFQYFFRIYCEGNTPDMFSWSNIARVLVE